MHYLTWLSLEWRLIALLALFAVIGAGLNALAIRHRSTSRSFPFLWIPLGWLSLTTLSYVAMRLCVAAHIANPFGLIVAAALGFTLSPAAWGLADPAARAQIWRTIAAPANRTRLAGVILATLIAGNITFLPIIQDGDALYLSGIGTDATGYIRTARAIQDGWYFAPIPELTPDHALRYPGRMWVYLMMSNADRPGACLTVALTSFLTGTNTLQGYFLSGSYLSVLLLHLAFWALSNFRPGPLWLLAPCIVFSSGLAGNYYQQFYGQCLGTLTLLIIPVLILMASGAHWMAVAGIGLVVGLVPTLSYGVQVADLACVTWLATLGLSIRARQEIPQTIRRGGAVLAGFGAGVLLSGIPLHSLLQKTPTLFNITFDLARFGNESTIAAHADLLFLGLYLPFSLAVTVALGTLWFARNLPCRQHATLLTGLSLLLLAVVGAIAVLHAGDNKWAAYKALYFLAPAVSLVLAASAAALRHAGFLRAGATLAVVPLIAGGIGAITFGFYAGNLLHTDSASLRPAGMAAVLSQAHDPAIKAVYFDSFYVHRYLLFLTEMDGSAKPILAPFSLWRAGPGVVFSAEAGRAIHAGLLASFQAGTFGSPRLEIRDSGDRNQVKAIRLP